MKLDQGRFLAEQLDSVNMPSPGTVAAQGHHLGVEWGEPLLYGLSGAVRYAYAHHARYEGWLADDYVLGPAFLDWLKGLRALLNGEGCVAMEHGVTRDSKDNTVCESLFWQALTAAGFSEGDL